jgi:hypothetical protein
MALPASLNTGRKPSCMHAAFQRSSSGTCAAQPWAVGAGASAPEVPGGGRPVCIGATAPTGAAPSAAHRARNETVQH